MRSCHSGIFLVFAALVACSIGEGTPPDVSPAGGDSGPRPMSDGGRSDVSSSSTGRESGLDAGTESGLDAGTGSGLDAGSKTEDAKSATNGTPCGYKAQ